MELESYHLAESIANGDAMVKCDAVEKKEEGKKKSPLEKYGQLLGGMHINYTLYFFIPLVIFSCLYCYHMAVKKKEQPPFPHATITNTACHYSQDIVFRALMLPAGSFIVLVYFVAFEYLKKEKKRIDFPFSTEQWLKKWSLISVLGFYCAIGTIDGAGYPDIHSIGAIFFFIVLFVTAGTITIVMREMRRWDTTSFSKKSILIKIVIVGYITGVALYCGIGAIASGTPANGDDIHVVILEWNLTLGGLVWLLTFVLDWKDIFITLRGDFSKTVKMVGQ